MDPGNLQNHVVILTKNSGDLRNTLADGIESIARKLHERFVVKDYQLRKILEAVIRQPEDGVSELIAIIKGSQRYYDEFIQCLSDLGYTGLVQKLKGTGSAAVGTTEDVRYGRLPVTFSLEPFGTYSSLDFSLPDVRLGTMSDVDLGKITSNHDYLVDNIKDPIQLCERLHQKGVMNKPDIDWYRAIHNIWGRGGATRRLLIFLFDRGDVYDTFIECLKECGYNSVVDRLENDGGGTGSAAVGTTDKVRYGRMPDVDSMKIMRNADYLVYNITDPIQLCERLHQKGVFDKSDIYKCRDIGNAFGWRITTERLLLILLHRGDVYDTFIECLKECGYNSLVDRLKNDDGDKVVRGKMDKEHLSIWRRGKYFLLSELTYDLLPIVQAMYRYGIIDDIDKQDIERESRTPEGDANGAKKLLEILENRGKNVLPRIIKALKAINHEVGDYLQARINGSKKRKRGIVNTT